MSENLPPGKITTHALFMRYAIHMSLFFLSACFFSESCLAETPNDSRHPTQRKEKPSTKEIELERAWIAVDKTSAASLQAYLDKKPKGSRTREAEMLLPVAKKLEAILSGKEKPALVIPFAAYGERIPGNQKKVAVAVSYDAKQRTEKDIGACWTYRSPEFDDCSSFSKGPYAALAYTAFPRSSMAGPGSILAFDSNGERCPSDRQPVIVTAKGKIVYFGV
ncbi:MAG: hypothetical protein CFE26_17320, partial [Verrucomicrobiales bacterium VVV1]